MEGQAARVELFVLQGSQRTIHGLRVGLWVSADASNGAERRYTKVPAGTHAPGTATCSRPRSHQFFCGVRTTPSPARTTFFLPPFFLAAFLPTTFFLATTF